MRMSASSVVWASAGTLRNRSATSAVTTDLMLQAYPLAWAGAQPRLQAARSPANQRACRMADTLHDPQAATQHLRGHEQTFHVFGKVVLFAILHVVLVLACLALAFLGNSPMIALILGIG